MLVPRKESVSVLDAAPWTVTTGLVPALASLRECIGSAMTTSHDESFAESRSSISGWVSSGIDTESLSVCKAVTPIEVTRFLDWIPTLVGMTLRGNQASPQRTSNMSISLMPRNGTTTPPSP